MKKSFLLDADEGAGRGDGSLCLVFLFLDGGGHRLHAPDHTLTSSPLIAPARPRKWCRPLRPATLRRDTRCRSVLSRKKSSTISIHPHTLFTTFSIGSLLQSAFVTVSSLPQGSSLAPHHSPLNHVYCSLHPAVFNAVVPSAGRTTKIEHSTVRRPSRHRLLGRVHNSNLMGTQGTQVLMPSFKFISAPRRAFSSPAC